MTASGLSDSYVDGNHETIADVSGQTAPAAFSLLSLHGASQLWSNSAPETITIEQLNPTSSTATSLAEVTLSLWICFDSYVHRIISVNYSGNTRSIIWYQKLVHICMYVYKKLSYRGETARQLHMSFSVHSLIMHFTEHRICFTTI